MPIIFDGECDCCGHPIRRENRTGLCGDCQRLLKCSVCEGFDGREGRVCAECRKVLALIDGKALGNKYRQVPPDHEERLALYTERAEAGQPLFS
jgi:hypothetical protein